MKAPISVVALLALTTALAGCSDKSAAPAAGTNTTSSSGNPVDAPVDYLKAVVNAQQTAVKTADTVSLNQAIQQFSVDHGRYPKDLNELVEQKYIGKLPQPPYGTKIVYDVNSGSVKVEK